MSTRANASFHTSNTSHEAAKGSACTGERLAQENARLYQVLTECDYLLLERERQITAQLERIE